MSRAFVRNALGVALAAGVLAIGFAQSRVDAQSQAFEVVTVAEGLQNPWSMAWLPNGDMLVTERPGRLRLIRGGTLQAEPIAGVPEVRARGQGGLLDVAVHPGFASNGLIYLTFSKPNADGSQGTTALIRARLDGNRLADVQEIFEAKAWSNSNGHYGSRLAFDSGGYLFMTIGDRQAPQLVVAVAVGDRAREFATGGVRHPDLGRRHPVVHDGDDAAVDRDVRPPYFLGEPGRAPGDRAHDDGRR